MLNPEASSTLCLPLPNQFLTLLASPSDLLDSFTLNTFQAKILPQQSQIDPTDQNGADTTTPDEDKIYIMVYELHNAWQP